MDSELIYRLALSFIPAVNRVTAARILEKIGTPEEVFATKEKQLREILGVKSRAFNTSAMQGYLEKARLEAAFMQKSGVEPLWFQDEGKYPARLSQCSDAPAILYKLGQTDLDSTHLVAVVGTRHATAYGVDFTRKLVLALAESLDSLVIVSGLAYGIDVAAHRAALEAGVPTVAVCAQPLNTVYPAVHRDTAAKMVRNGGAMVSEYSTSAHAVHRGNFLARNRIIAGMCDAVVVVESDVRGGAMATARIGADYSRDVFAVPGRVGDKYSSGTNRLIANDTAHLLSSADDIIEIMGWIPRLREGQQKSLPILTPLQEQVLDTIRNHPDFTVNDIAVNLGMSYSQLTEQLFQLEMDNFIVALPGQKYAVAAY